MAENNLSFHSNEFPHRIARDTQTDRQSEGVSGRPPDAAPDQLPFGQSSEIRRNDE